MRLTPKQFVAKFKALDACTEAVDWIGHASYPDFAAAWRGCEYAQWMCWLATRLVGVEGARGVIACARTVAKRADPKLTDTAIDLAQAHLDGKANDLEKLRIAAYDCAEAGIHPRAANGCALMSASYTAHCILQFKKHASLPDGSAEKKKALLKACGHAADAVFHAIDADREGARKLPDLVRAKVNEAALIRVWDRVPDR